MRRYNDESSVQSLNIHECNLSNKLYTLIFNKYDANVQLSNLMTDSH